MKRPLVMFVLAVMLFAFAEAAMAAGVGDYPDKGWHKGPYIAASVGMVQSTNDKHAITGRSYDGSIDPAFGLTFGWDIADWIGPMFQATFATTTGEVGDPNNTNAPVTYGGNTFPKGTFPVQNARQYIGNLGLFIRATLPYFVRAGWQPNSVKIIPYAKLGGVGHAMYVNASNTNNKIGAYGGGPSVGLGCEFLVWKGLFLAVDMNENLIFQGSYSRNITTTGGTKNLKVLDGGFKPSFQLAGLFGWHF